MIQTREPLNPYEALTCLLAVPQDTISNPAPIIGSVRLTLMLFLLGYEEGLPSLQTVFQPSPYGPYAEDLLPHLDTLQNLDMIRIDKVPQSVVHPFAMLTRLNALEIMPGGRSLSEIVRTQITADGLAAYTITARGKEFFRTVLSPRCHEKALLARAIALKFRCQPLSTTILVQYIAHRYPAYFSDTALTADLIRWIDT